MPKLGDYSDGTGRKGVWFECPGCKMTHAMYVEGAQHPVWEFNGNLEKPTLRPSLLSQFTYKGQPVVCHSFVTDGQIQFLSDSTHDLSGKTVDLPEFEE